MKRGIEVFAEGLYLDENRAFPKAVGVTLQSVGELHAVLKRGDGDGIHAEHVEELLQEALRLALLVVGVLPAFLERRCVLADFIP